MSASAREARSKGGKARAETTPAPNWKHGKYARSFIMQAFRPCKSTCPQYPCDNIAEGMTKPGDACFDKTAVIHAYKAIIDAVGNKNTENFHDIAAFSIAQAIHIVNMLMEDIMRDGTVLKKAKLDPFGKVIGYEYVLHPSLLPLPKLIAELSLTPPEFLTTPRSIAKNNNEKEGVQTLSNLMSKIGKAASGQETKSKEEGDDGDD